MHVCVIGAGVVGLTTAYFLSQENHTVTVIDGASGPASGASAANGAQLSYAFVAPLAEPSVPPQLPRLLLARDSPLKLHFRFDPAQWRWGIDFLRASTRVQARETTAALLKLAELSREFIEPLIEGEGIDCHFSRGGKLVVYGSAAALEAARKQVLYQAGLGSRQTVLSPEDCVNHELALAGYKERIAGGVWTATDAAADCRAFCVQLAERMQARGVTFAFGRAAEGFDRDGTRVRLLQTSQGPLRADAYVIAAGTGADELGANAGLRLPIYPLRGYSITVKPAGDALLPRASITDARRKVVFAPLGDRVRVAGFVEIGAKPDGIPPARIGALLQAAREVLGYSSVDGDLSPWAGDRPATPTGRPIIGRTPLVNLFINVGHGALGWTLAAGSARLVCDAISNRDPTIVDTAFAYRA